MTTTKGANDAVSTVPWTSLSCSLLQKSVPAGHKNSSHHVGTQGAPPLFSSLPSTFILSLTAHGAPYASQTVTLFAMGQWHATADELLAQTEANGY
jgi:hypothetical protein